MKKLGLGFAFAALCGGCFVTPDFTSGTIECSTDPNNPCPSGATCIDNVCYKTPDLAVEVLDAGTD